MRFAENALGLVGDTPLVRLNRVVPPNVGTVLAKVEFLNPGGSVKDRIGVSMIEAAEAAGLLRPGGTIVEPTSGNTGVGLAIAAIVKGYKLVCTMADKAPKEKVRLLELLGAEVHVCPTNVEPDDPKSYYSVAKRLVDERDGFSPNQYFNDANPEAHYRSTGPEIWRDTEGRLDAFVCGVGTGGTISGTGRYLREKNPKVEIVGVDPKGSILKEVFETGENNDPAQGYLVDGIGEDLVPGSLKMDAITSFEQVQDAESYEMALRLAREEGILGGSSAGSAVVGAIRVAKRLGPGKTVVVLLPDSGERYLSKLNDEWLAAQGLVKPQAAR